jgi:hypothetical protein
LNVAVSGEGPATVQVFESLDVSARQFATNLIVGGALTAFDKDAAENYITSFVGNEIGSFIGTTAANALGRSWAEPSRSYISPPIVAAAGGREDKGGKNLTWDDSRNTFVDENDNPVKLPAMYADSGQIMSDASG